MSSTEPPSRVPPRGQSHESKSAREEISSKGKVEKVREVDADETRKQKKWKATFYEEDQLADTDSEAERRPSPYELYSQRPAAEGPAAPRSQMSDVEDAIVPSPSYTVPPDVGLSFDMGQEEEEEDPATTGALPQSDDFWEDVDFPPDRQAPPQQFMEKTTQRGDLSQQPSSGTKGKKEKKEETAAGPIGKGAKKDKMAEPSPFGPPGKPIGKETGKKSPFASKEAGTKLPSPFDEAAKSSSAGRSLDKEEERYLGASGAPPKSGKKTAKEKADQEAYFAQAPGAAPMRSEEREGGGGGKRGRDEKIVEITSPSLAGLPADIQPTAEAAVKQVASYLHPSTVSLFLQMVGTIYMMTATTPGISRTEIVLNNPSYSDSKFFGSTITIEKYASAPDSFNIRLTGSDAAVAAFRDNIPSLMTAFQQGNFAFKVNRLDVEYSLERPVFRRKEKGEEKGEKGGGDLGKKR